MSGITSTGDGPSFEFDQFMLGLPGGSHSGIQTYIYTLPVKYNAGNGVEYSFFASGEFPSFSNIAFGDTGVYLKSMTLINSPPTLAYLLILVEYPAGGITLPDQAFTVTAIKKPDYNIMLLSPN